MMVEMDRPFVWPEEPKNFEAYVWIFFRFCFEGDSKGDGSGISKLRLTTDTE